MIEQEFLSSLASLTVDEAISKVTEADFGYRLYHADWAYSLEAHDEVCLHHENGVVKFATFGNPLAIIGGPLGPPA